MSTQTAPPEMFANAPVPESVSSDGTPAPTGVPMGRVIGTVVAVVLLVGGVALWSVSPKLVLVVGGVALVIGGLALLAPKLAARRAGKPDRKAEKRPGGGRRRWTSRGEGGRRPNDGGRVPFGGSGRGAGLPGFRSGPRTGMPTVGGGARSGAGPSARSGTGSGPTRGLARFRRGERASSDHGAPQSGLARLRQRLSPTGRNQGATTTESGGAKSRWRSPFRGQRAPGSGQESTKGRRLPGRKGSSGSSGAGDTPSGGQRGRSGSSGTPSGASTSRRWWRPSSHQRGATGGVPGGTSRMAGGSAPDVPATARRPTNAARTGRNGGQASGQTRRPQTDGPTTTRRPPGGVGYKWRHPVQRAKDARQRLHRAGKKPPKKQTLWQYWFAPTRPVKPPKAKGAAEGEPRETSAYEKNSTYEKNKAKYYAEHSPAPEPPRNVEPIVPLSADDAGIPHVPPPVHGRGPTRAAAHYDTTDTRLPVPTTVDRSSAASAFDDMGPLAPPGRKPKMTTSTDTDLSHYTNMVDTSTPESQAETCNYAAGEAQSDGHWHQAKAQELRDDARGLTAKGLGGAVQANAEADEMERTARLRFEWADGFLAKAAAFLNRRTSV